ncbi:hypothetical protein EKO04_004841 [Ascochyta lentis]|uniref:Uncharacterized protein n=1 Tax=Ascochyta lentis TaxID=205686 RepID=A0A8H7MJG2_9PLEO|nr:hypothetical protein EKO04_004841 [Ascochyta lentis]
MRTTSPSVRASLILPQDFSLFVKWQKQHAPGSEIGQISEALEYYYFIRHRDALLGSNPPTPLQSGPRIATDCGHTVHPGDTMVNDLCPVCEVKAHLAFMHAIKVAWNKAGGPTLSSGTHKIKKSYTTLRDAWHAARLQFQELLDMFAILVLYEEDWEAKNPLQAAAAQIFKCASAAIKLAEAESEYPARLSPVSAKLTEMKPSQKRRDVSFATQVQVQGRENIFLTATNFVPSQPQSLCYRSSSAYKRGAHACPPDSEFIDTSQANSLSANVSNLKIYLTDDKDAFDSLEADPTLYSASVGDHQGIVGLHRLADDILKFIQDYLAQDGMAKNDLEAIVEEADRMVVLVDEHKKLIDAFLFDGSVEDEGSNGKESVDETDKGVDQRSWTCLRKCLL